jgi:hypothetical protein
MAADTPTAPAPREAGDVIAFGQESGRVLSDGRIVGRAEPFAKVFPSSRAVKRVVGLMAWAVLEDIALDARIDDRGRLVAETTVRRIAANLGLNKDTVTKHLGRLREHGFVFQEESREVTSGRWEPCRYVLDPSACIERFTVTPERTDTRRSQPCPKPSDTVPRPVSDNTGHGGTGQGGFGRHERHVVEDQQQHVAHRTASNGEQSQLLRGRLEHLGVAGHVADDLVGRYPHDRIRDAVDAAELRGARNTAGWVVTALRDGWDLSGMLAEHRAQQARQEREAQQAADGQAATEVEQQRRDRAVGWSSAVSAALDDDQLATAIAKVTTPLAGLQRSSVPLAHAQLVAWAADVHRRAPDVPLEAALDGSLRNGARPCLDTDGTALPEPPASGDQPDLTARIAEHLQATGDREPAMRGATHDETHGREL